MFLCIAYPLRPDGNGGEDLRTLLDSHYQYPMDEISSLDMDDNGKWLFKYNYILDRFADDAVHMFGPGKGCPGENGDYPRWRLEEWMVPQLEDSSDAVLQACKRLVAADPQGQCRGIAEQAVRVVHDEGQSRWQPCVLVRWEYLAGLDECIFAAKLAQVFADEPSCTREQTGVHYLLSADPAYAFDDSPRVKPNLGGIVYRVLDGSVARLLIKLYKQRYDDEPFRLVACPAIVFDEESYIEVSQQLDRLNSIVLNLRTEYHPSDATVEAMAVCASRLPELENQIQAGRALAAADASDKSEGATDPSTQAIADPSWPEDPSAPEVAPTAESEGASPPRSDDEVRQLISDMLPTAVSCVMGLRGIVQLTHFYPGIIDPKELGSLRDELTSMLVCILHQPGYERFLAEYEHPTLAPVGSDQHMSLLLSVLLMWHPVGQPGNTPQQTENNITAAAAECPKAALEPCQAILKRLSELMLYDCRIPHPHGDASFEEPRCFVQMARTYWDLCRQLVLQRMNALAGYQPHPLLRLIVNIRSRLDACLERLDGCDGARDVRDNIDRLLDAVISSEDELQILPEYAVEQINAIDIFLETLRIKLGSRSSPLTYAEMHFVKSAQESISAHEASTKTLEKKFLHEAKVLAKRLDRSRPSATTEHARTGGTPCPQDGKGYIGGQKEDPLLPLRPEINHVDITPRPSQDQAAAARWASKCLQELAAHFCSKMCSGCRPNDRIFREDLLTEEQSATLAPGVISELTAARTEWRQHQLRLHEAFSYVKPLHNYQAGCPACLVTDGLRQFPRLASHSPSPPVATVTMYYGTDMLDDWDPTAPEHSVPESFPCCDFENCVEGEVVHRWSRRREDALADIDLSQLPPMPPPIVEEIRSALSKAQDVIRIVWALASDANEVVERHADQSVAAAPSQPRPSVPSNNLPSIDQIAGVGPLAHKVMFSRLAELLRGCGIKLVKYETLVNDCVQIGPMSKEGKPLRNAARNIEYDIMTILHQAEEIVCAVLPYGPCPSDDGGTCVRTLLGSIRRYFTDTETFLHDLGITAKEGSSLVATKFSPAIEAAVKYLEHTATSLTADAPTVMRADAPLDHPTDYSDRRCDGSVSVLRPDEPPSTHQAHLAAAKRLIESLTEFLPEGATDAEVAYAEAAAIEHLKELFGEQDDALGNWPADWHECPEVRTLYERKIMEYRSSHPRAHLTAAEQHVSLEQARQTCDRLAAGTSLEADWLSAAEIEDRVRKLGPLDGSILLLGETGTGKEFYARKIHKASRRATVPFVVVNCATLLKERIDGDLFGHTKGAFTGAIQDQPGKVRMAAGGTLLLDEIGDLPSECWGNLLRFLEHKEIHPVGSRTTTVDVRIMAATNRDKQIRVEARHRFDHVLKLPPLRARRQEIASLANAFFKAAKGTASRLSLRFTSGEREKLGQADYDWPGNIRQLERAIRQAVDLHDAGRELTCEAVLKAARSAVESQ